MIRTGEEPLVLIKMARFGLPFLVTKWGESSLIQSFADSQKEYNSGITYYGYSFVSGSGISRDVG